MTILARKTKKTDDVDILIIDTGIRRRELITLIKETASLHKWDHFEDLSESVDEQHDFKPDLRKRITRKVKSLPIIKPFYDKSLDKYLGKRDGNYRAILSSVFSKWTKNVNCSCELFLMTQTYLNRPLVQLFPNAAIHYMEHGIGDYYYFLEKEIPKGDFFAVFSKPYSQYLLKTGRTDLKAIPIPGINEFPVIAAGLFNIHTKTLELDKLHIPEKPVIYILLEAVDMYEVREEFWTAYIDHILTKVNTPEKYHFILKLHPMHSKHSLVRTEDYFRKLSLEFSVLGNEKLSSASAEVLFSKWAKNTEHVFCLFSSGCFYLSQLYDGLNIKFWYSTEFFSHYIENAPPQYKNLFVEIKPLLDEVLAEKCTAY